MGLANGQTLSVAEFATSADPPEATLDWTKLRAIDALGCALAGSAHELFDAFRSSLADWGIGGATHSIAAGDELSLLQAIALDAAATRLWDHDDVDDITGDHPSVATVPAALALAQAQKIPAAEWLRAVAIAQEVQLRIRMGSSERLGTSGSSHPWTTGTYAPFGSAVLTSRLTDGSVDHMVASLGHAFAYASNTAQSQSEGGNIHLFHQGVATALGVQAARAVTRGVTGVANVFEGRFGVYRALHRASGPNELLTDRLGVSYNIDRVAAKKYATCRHAQGMIEAVLKANSEEVLTDVESVSVGLGESAIAIMNDGSDLPRSSAEAAFHFRFLCALALSEGRVDIPGFFSAGSERRDSVQRWMQRIEIHRDESLSREDERAAAAQVTFVASDRRAWTVADRPGSLDASAIRRKFVESAIFGTRCTEKRAAVAFSDLVSALSMSANVGLDVIAIVRALRE